MFYVLFCVILLQKISLPITSLPFSQTLSHQKFLGVLVFLANHLRKIYKSDFQESFCLDLYLKYILQLDRDNLWRHCVSSGLRSTLSFDLLPSCILFTLSSLIFVLLHAWSHSSSPPLPLCLEDPEISRVFCILLQGLVGFWSPSIGPPQAHLSCLNKWTFVPGQKASRLPLMHCWKNDSDIVS